MDIRQTVSEKLREIEQTQDVRILYCVESGSRAWGFASPDSDYDVRFIYARPREFYLKLEDTRDVIEWQLDDTLDINGWDLRKMLQLLYKSNPTVFEWNNSPIVYKEADEWERVRRVIGGCFQVKAGLYHYLSTVKSNYHAHFKGEQVKLKKYFYVLRPLLACRYIIDSKMPPPMLFSELVRLHLEPSVKPFVDKLLETKKVTSELGTGGHIPQLDEYIEKGIDDIQKAMESLPDQPRNDWQALNECFLDIVGR